jgi:hypothetical protein
MSNQILKYLSLLYLSLVLLNIPSVLLASYSASISSFFSYFMFLISGILIFSYKKRYPKNIKIFFIFSILYFCISLINYRGELHLFLIEFIKFSMFYFGLYAVLDNVNTKSILILLVLGSITILLDALFFRFKDIVHDDFIVEFGRYAGFYLNANSASAVCMFGYSIALCTNYRLRIWILLLFTLMGIMTLSRTFVIAWILINLFYIIKSPKHLKFFPLFILIPQLIIAFKDSLGLRPERVESLLNSFNTGSIDKKLLNNDSRQQLWEFYYEFVANSPFIGNGSNTFQGGELGLNEIGVHNNFMVLIGESGFLPFILFIGFFIYLFLKSYKYSSISFLPFLIFIVVLIQFLISHTFFTMGIRIFMMTFLIYLLNNSQNEKNFSKTKT